MHGLGKLLRGNFLKSLIISLFFLSGTVSSYAETRNYTPITTEVQQEQNTQTHNNYSHDAVFGQKNMDRENSYQQAAGSVFALIFQQVVNFFNGLVSAFTDLFNNIFNLEEQLQEQEMEFTEAENDRKIRADIAAEKGLQQEKMAQDAFHDWRHDQRLDIQMNVEHKRQLDRDKAIIRYEAESFIYSGAAGAICERNSSFSSSAPAFGSAYNDSAIRATAWARRGAGSAGTGRYARRGGSGGGGSSGGSGGGGASGSSGGDGNDMPPADTAGGPIDETEGGYALAVLFCAPSDINDAAAVFCPATCPGDAQKCQKAERLRTSLSAPGDPEFVKGPHIYNLDVDYTNAIDLRRTWGFGNYWQSVEENGKIQPEVLNIERSVYADKGIADFFTKNIYREAVTPLTPNAIEAAYNPDTGYLDNNVMEHLLDRKSLEAIRSVGKNSFINIISRKSPTKIAPNDQNGGELTILNQAREFFLPEDLGEGGEPVQPGVGNEYLLANMFKEFEGTPEDGEAPSYEAQLEFLAKLIYLNPHFTTGTDEKFESNLQTMTATKSIVSHEIMQSEMRQEAILAAMLEVLLDGRQDKVEAQSRRIVDK